MKLAIDNNGNKIEPSLSGQRAKCPGCNSDVVAKIYRDKVNHWAHLKKDCDSWYEPMSEWHFKWQNVFPNKNQEIVMYDESGLEFHRADVRLNNGVVIEFQNSPIVIDQVLKREEFYHKEGLIWVLNAKELIPDSYYYSYERAKNLQVELRMNYHKDMNNWRNEFLNFLDRRFNGISRSEFLVQDEQIIYYYIDNSDMEEDSIHFTINNELNQFNKENGNKYRDWIKTVSVFIYEKGDEREIYHRIMKNRWKKFIDNFRSPVFLDNLAKIDTNYLYWIQENKIIKKDEFIREYLKFT